MKYLLKHRDDRVCELTLDETGNIIKTGKIFDERLLPLGGNLSVQELKKWWQRRAVPVTQAGIVSFLQKIDKTNTEFLTDNLGLSMTDHYWICPEGQEQAFCWKDINFFQNQFEELKEPEKIGSASQSLVPGASLSGDQKKYWYIDKGQRWLLKENEGSSSQQSLNEILATEIHRLQAKQPYTVYQLVPHPEGIEKGYCCISPAFTNEHTEFINAYDLVSSEKKPNNRSYYEHFITICAEHGLPEEITRSFLEYQILTDFLITNTDRHFQNFGVLRDSETLAFVGMAPIFDSGNSMFWNYHVIPSSPDKYYAIRTESFRGTELELLGYIRNFDSPVNLELLPSDEYLYDLYRVDQMPEERLAGLVQAFHQKQKMLKQFLTERKLVIPGQKYMKKPRVSL